MECNLGVGKVWSSTRNPVDQIMGAKTDGQQVHFAVTLLFWGLVLIFRITKTFIADLCTLDMC